MMPPPDREPFHVHRAEADPLHVELVDVEDARIRSEILDGRRELGVIAFVTTIILLAIFAAAMLAAPRAASDTVLSGPSSSPVLPGAPRSPQVVEDNGAPPAAERWAGTATWYCSASSTCTRGYDPGDLVAAIDTDLGIPKGSTVVVRSARKSVTVRIVDVCACAGERLIDLTSGAFRRLAPLEAGVIHVTIEIAGSSSTLPPTDAGG